MVFQNIQFTSKAQTSPIAAANGRQTAVCKGDVCVIESSDRFREGDGQSTGLANNQGAV